MMIIICRIVSYHTISSKSIITHYTRRNNQRQKIIISLQLMDPAFLFLFFLTAQKNRSKENRLNNLQSASDPLSFSCSFIMFMAEQQQVDHPQVEQTHLVPCSSNSASSPGDRRKCPDACRQQRLQRQQWRQRPWPLTMTPAGHVQRRRRQTAPAAMRR